MAEVKQRSEPYPPPPGGRRRGIYIWWGIALTLLAALGLVCWLAVAPVVRVRAMLRTHVASGEAVKRLGGPRRAASAVMLYMRLPEKWSPNRATACGWLGRCGPHGVPALTRALNQGNYGTKWSALNALSELGPVGTDALPEVIGILEKEDQWLGHRAAHCIGEMYSRQWHAPPFCTCTASINQGLPHALPKNREAGQQSNYRPPGDRMTGRAVSALAAALEGPHRTVRVNAAGALYDIGPRGRDARPALVAILRDQEGGEDGESLRINAIAAIASFGPPEDGATAPLMKYLSSASREERAAAATALGLIGAERQKVVPIMKRLIKDKDFHVRCGAAHTLLLAGEEGPWLDVLIEMLRHEDRLARHSAATHLWSLGPAAKRAIPALEELLDDEEPAVARAAAEALEKIKPAEEKRNEARQQAR